MLRKWKHKKHRDTAHHLESYVCSYGEARKLGLNSACGGRKRDDYFTCFDETSHKIVSVEFNDLVHDLNLSKHKVEVLAQDFNSGILLKKIYHSDFILHASFPLKKKSLPFCYDIEDLLKELCIAHEPNECGGCF
ncbi:uncharacterized protein TNIN_158221 [Trichonephila inaurata madagascariensis]|uniref:Uncharacterized protein n=1 Tax=Trichonephila inaurata madagascariensis TaxID=2747483 RepID=A0A8X6XA58_9ARAC|nr:uncharacterized protein TNIN_158221 [Trichonephila inaurata madagascariensis]